MLLSGPNVVVICALLGSQCAGQDKPAVVAVLWGKPVDGLQAGIRIQPRDRSRETLEIDVIIRNVGKNKLVVQHELAPRYFWGENDAGVVSARVKYLYGGYAQRGVKADKMLSPGDEWIFGSMEVLRVREGLEHSPLPAETKIRLAPGTYRIGADRVELRVGDGWKVELDTGYADVVIPAAEK